MNLLLLQDSQFISVDQAIANSRQKNHVRNILRRTAGDTISVGKLNGLLGTGIISSFEPNLLIDNIKLERQPSSALPLTLLLAMPRPQMLKRILQTCAAMGVKKICFLQTSRVEKSFWQSPSASDEAMREQLILGLEQGMATQLPIIERYQRFRPFVEDTLDTLAGDALRYIAHPGAQSVCREHTLDEKITLAIGPEGGFLEQEVAQFIQRGFTPLTLGPRILKVETAVPVLLAKLFQTPFK